LIVISSLVSRLNISYDEKDIFCGKEASAILDNFAGNIAEVLKPVGVAYRKKVFT
jgi:hypothetical protein